jgi:aldehyde:ferredoxin oxidoreductase
MKGSWGRILAVDLTTGKIEDRPVPEEFYRDFLGGSGLAARLFFELKGYGAEPLAPDNPLFVMNGPVSGTSFPGGSRLQVCARSPLTGIWGESSMGGHASPALKGTGYDGIVFTGASEKPVYLYLSDAGAELRDAAHLWGEDTFATEERLKEELGDKRAAVMSIGPAGENLVRYAGIVTDQGSLAARCGLGAVMGSKRLKAIALRGKRKYQVADEPAYKRIRQEALDNIRKSVFAEGLSLFGTTGGVEISTAICDIPVKNWTQSRWLEGMKSLSGVTIAETILTRTRSCYACPIACKLSVEIKDGDYPMEEGPGPEYEGVGSLGFMLKIEDMRAVVKANALCNRYGMDNISTGATLAYAIEAFEKGLITEEDTGGMTLGWNRPDQLVELLGKTAARQGFGDILAEGSRAMAGKFGGADFAIQVKGMECAMHDPRALWSMALSYATSIRGGCHNRDTNLGLEMGMDSLEEIGYARTQPRRPEGKAMQTIYAQEITSVIDSAVLCVFAWKGMGSSLAMVRDLINAVTGYGLDFDDLLETGRRIWCLKRAIGNLCGMTAADDQLPERMISPHLEGTTSDLLNVARILVRVNTRICAMLTNEKLLDGYKRLLGKVILPNSYRSITLLGKLMAPFQRSNGRFRGVEVKQAVESHVAFDEMLAEYYQLRRLDQRGFPERALLEELGLAEAADALARL